MDFHRSRRALAHLEVSEFVADRFRQKGTERLFQEVVESAVDIDLHIL